MSKDSIKTAHISKIRLNHDYTKLMRKSSVLISRSPDRKYRTEKVAPEGGWGWMVGIGLTLPFACGLGSLQSFGLMFNEFLAELGAEAGAITTVTGVYFGALSIAGICSGPIMRKLSLRSVGLLGAFIYTTGGSILVFVNSVELLIFAFGFMQGFGIGLMIPVGYSNFNKYFIKRRVFVMSLSQALKGVMITMHPILVKVAMNAFGFRGTMAIIAAVNAHSILGMLVMQPVEWHLKSIKVPEPELKPLMDKVNENDVAVVLATDEDTNVSDKNDMKNDNGINAKTQNIVGVNNDYIKTERSKSLNDATDLEAFNAMKNRVASIVSTNGLGGDALIERTPTSSESGIWAKFVNFFDLTLLKDLVYTNTIIGMASGLFSDNIFSSVLPMYLNSLGFSRDDAAIIVSTGSACDMFSRFFLAFLSLFVHIKARSIFLGGAVAIILLRIVFLYVYSFTGMLMMMAFIGFFRTWLHLPMALIIAECLPNDRFASGYGLFTFLQGNFVFVFGPFVGWVRDTTQSYVAFVHSLQFFMAVCVVPWITEIVWNRWSKKTDTKST